MQAPIGALGVNHLQRGLAFLPIPKRWKEKELRRDDAYGNGPISHERQNLAPFQRSNRRTADN